MRARLGRPRRASVDREVALPRTARFVGQSQLLEDECTIEERLGQPRIDLKRRGRGRQRLGVPSRSLLPQCRFVLRCGQIAPHPRVARGVRERLEPRDRLERFLDEDQGDARGMPDRGAGIASAALHEIAGGAVQLERRGVHRSLVGAERTAIRRPPESAAQSRLDHARRHRRERDEPIHRRAAGEPVERGAHRREQGNDHHGCGRQQPRRDRAPLPRLVARRRHGGRHFVRTALAAIEMRDDRHPRLLIDTPLGERGQRLRIGMCPVRLAHRDTPEGPLRDGKDGWAVLVFPSARPKSSDSPAPAARSATSPAVRPVSSSVRRRPAMSASMRR